jgi:hypothetical protein
MNAPSPLTSRPTRDPLIGYAVVALLVTGACMSGWMWHQGPDPVIDFGREVYVPWRLSEGEVLYRDIRYFNGPLTPYVHALVFTIAGESIRTIKAFNLLVIAGVTSLLFWLLREIGDLISATAACLAFLTLFAFSQFSDIANYSWLTAYSYDLTHGVALSLGMIACFLRYMSNGRCVWLILAGSVLGLVFLTKVEVFLAAAITAAVAMVLVEPPERIGRRTLSVALLLGTALVPVVVAWALLWRVMPAAQAAAGLVEGWRWLTDSTLVNLPFYREVRGTADLSASVRIIATSSAWYVAVMGGIVGCGWIAGRLLRRERVPVAAVALALAIVVAAWLLRRQVGWVHVIRPMPLILGLLAVTVAVLIWRHRRERSLPPGMILSAMLITFSGALLAKVMLSVRIDHYGFALSMPATMLLITLLVCWGPRVLERVGQRGIFMQLGALALLLVTIGAYLEFMHGVNARRAFAVGSGGDRFFADHRGQIIAEAVDQVLANTSRTQSLAVLPEGVLINYLARRVNPTRLLNLPPPEYIMYGGDEVLSDMQRGQPDLIVLVHSDTSGYGMRYFGRDYAQDVAQWIDRHYHVVSRIGAVPFSTGQFGILICRRKDPPAGAMSSP